VRVQGGALHLTWDSRDGLVDPDVLDAVFAAHVAALGGLADDEAAWDGPPAIGLPADQRARRIEFAATAAPRSAATLDDLFRAQVARSPDAPAVLAGDRCLDYAALACRADAVAAWLGERVVAIVSVVAIVMEKGWEEVVAALAAARGAAAYVPIDAAMPAARVRAILEHSGATVVLSQRRVLDAHPWLAGFTCLAVDELEPATTAVPGGPAGLARPDDLACVIYTSGSTGAPRGVMIDHRGAVNTLLDVNRRFAVGPSDRVLALSSMSLDLAVYDVFGTLAAGGALVIPDAVLAAEPSHWLALARRHGVSVWNSGPALMATWVAHLRAEPRPPPLRLALLSGGGLPAALPAAIRALHPDVAVVALGGATEASIWSIFYRVEQLAPDLTSVPYGRPLADQSVHVLDAELRPRPERVIGELYIGGVGVARGYWRAPRPDAGRFIVHPTTGERLYRTGDLGAMDPAGHIVLHGPA
jgi:pyochelin synthetase